MRDLTEERAEFKGNWCKSALFCINELTINFGFYMIGKEKINEIVNRIAQKFNPDKIILFGSYAMGNYNADSDLDFIIVKNSNLQINENRQNHNQKI